MTFTKFEDIEAWQLGRSLNLKIYNATCQGTFAKDYDLKSQIRRASISITSNIAEGFGRRSNKEFRNFLNYSRGSCAEVQSQLYIALDVKHINEMQFNELYAECDKISKMVLGLETYLSKTL